MLLKDYTRSYVINNNVAVNVKDFYIDYDNKNRPLIAATWVLKSLQTGLSIEVGYDRYLCLNDRGEVCVNNRQTEGTFNLQKVYAKLKEYLDKKSRKRNEDGADDMLYAVCGIDPHGDEMYALPYLSRAQEELHVAYYNCTDKADMSYYVDDTQVCHVMHIKWRLPLKFTDAF